MTKLKDYDSLLPDRSYLEGVMQDHVSKIVKDHDNIIMSAFREKGYPIDDIEFIKNHLVRAQHEGDPFDYYLADDVPVIKIKREPDYDFSNNIMKASFTFFKF